MDKRGYMLQPRSAEITRQRATQVEAIFPADQPSLYSRLKARVSDLLSFLFPSSEPPLNPLKRPSTEVAPEPKRPKPVSNRFSCVSSSLEGEEEEPKPAPADRKLFTPVITRSHLRAFARPQEESKVVSVAPANPRLQQSPPKLDKDFEANVMKQEFERQVQAILDARIQDFAPTKSKTPTPRRDDLLHQVKSPQIQERQSPPAAPHTAEAQPPKPIEQAPRPPVRITFPEVPEAPKPEVSKPVETTQPVVQTKVETKLEAPAVSFFAKAEEFKQVEPESPGFVASDESSQKETSDPVSEVAEFSPIKDLCAKPETVPTPPVLNPIQSEPVLANPFAGPPPPNNPFLMPAAAPSTSAFVFGSSQPLRPMQPPVLNQPAVPNPFSAAPVPAPSTWQSSEDAEMRAETPRGPYGAVPAMPVQVPPGALFPFQPLGSFQTTVPAPVAPPQPSGGAGSFSIGQVGNRRIYRAKRSGQ